MGGSGGSGGRIALLPRLALLSLYKHTLRSAHRFPSSNRAGIIREIRATWRENASLVDGEKCHVEQSRAVDGLRMLRQYEPLRSDNTGVWNLHLGQDK